MSRYGAVDRRSSSSLSGMQGDSSSATPSPTTPLSKVSRLAFYSFGVTVLIPWNALTLALPYLLSKFSDSSLRPYLGSWLSITYTASGLIGLCMTTWLGDKLRPTPSITLSVCATTLVLLLLTNLPLWSTSQETLFATILVSASLLASSSAFFRTPIVAVATTFGPDALAAYFSGTALVAVVISASVFATTYISNAQGHHGGKHGAILCFVISAFATPLGLLAYYLGVRHTDIYKQKFEPKTIHTAPQRDRFLQQQLVQVLLQGEGVWSTTKRNLGYNVSQFYVFIVTLAAFPVITTLVQPTRFPWNPVVFDAFHFLVYNLGDLAGRLLVSIPIFKHPILTHPTALLTYAIIRTVFIPLFFLCNIRLAPNYRTLPSLFGDIAFLSLLFVFALTNGHCSSLGFIGVGSKKGGRARNAARVLQLWMYAGLMVGSALSFGMGNGVGRWKGI